VPKTGSKEDRRYQRISTPKGVWVAWQDGARQSVSRVRDLNVGGLFIATPNPCPVSTVVSVLLSVPEGEIRSKAIVRNITAGEGMGIQFVDIPAQDDARLKKLIARLLESTPNIQK
jgi:PilZ domain